MARWWERPVLWQDEETVGERKVGFLDLFFDLIFVVAIAQIAHGLAKHPDGAGVVDFILLVIPVFWVWIGHTFYTDRFENRDLSHIFFTFATMLPVVGMAVFAHDGRGATAMGFALSYAAGRLLLVAAYTRASIHNPHVRKPFLAIGGGFSIGAIAWAISAFVDDVATRTAIQVAGLAWDFFVPILVAPLMQSLPNFAEGRLRERFGLLMIIVLGESVAGTVNGLADIHHIQWTDALTAIFAMVFAFGVYFTYFEMVPRMQRIAWRWAPMVGNYLHLLLVSAVAATGAGVLATVGQAHEALEDNIRIIVSGALAASYLVLLGLSRVHEYKFKGAGRRGTETGLVVAVLAAAAVGAFGTGWNSLQVLGVLAVVASVPWVVGVGAWRKLTLHLPKQPKKPTQG